MTSHDDRLSISGACAYLVTIARSISREINSVQCSTEILCGAQRDIS